jgi:GTPase
LYLIKRKIDLAYLIKKRKKDIIYIMDKMPKEAINSYIDTLEYSELVNLRNIITKKINILDKQKQNLDINKLVKAKIQIKDIYKCDSIGIVLVVDLITPGIIRQNFTYICPLQHRESKITIKNFETIFPSYQFEYPKCGIVISIRLTNCKFEDLYIGMILE